MRILIVAVASISLSGCSWLGLTHSHKSKSGSSYSSSSYSSGYSSASRRNNKPGKFSISGGLGTELVVGGNVLSAENTSFANPVRIENRSMKNAYKLGWRGELGGAYRIGKNQEVTLNGFYQTAKGKDMVIGTTAVGEVTGQLSAYKAYGVEAGLRHNMSTTKLPLLRSVAPYLEGRVGMANVTDVSLQNVSVNGLPPVPDLAFYKGKFGVTASALVGFEKPVSKKMSIGFETGIRYMGGLSGDNTDTVGTFLENSNQGGSRWSIPVQIRGRYRF